jgi:hypothetical protein
VKAPHLQLACLAAILLLVACIACGGGSSSGGSTPPPPRMTITESSILPPTLQNHSYSTALHATNGVGAVTWSIAPISPTTLFVDGLTIDPNTGVVSGTAAFGGTAGFLATVRDSSSPPRTAGKSFNITAYSPLQAPAPQTFSVSQFQGSSPLYLGNLNGVPPLTYTITGGSFPAGLKINSHEGGISGSATALGTYVSTITIQDSFSPPEVVTAQVTINVIPPTLSVAVSLPRSILRNRPYSGRVVASGGIPPYKFTLGAGSLPAGFSPIDPNTGRVSGTPTTLGNYGFTVNVSDSTTPVAQVGSTTFSIDIVDPIGRNDTIASATAVGNGFFQASISPYIDPPGSAPLPADNDYYKVVGLSGSTVQLETWAQRFFSGDPVDTVMEIVDGNNVRLATCQQPGSASNTFTSSCINDDIGGNPYTLDSALNFQVPGPANTSTTFYVHILDWRGDARPDMSYSLHVSGAVGP